MVKSIKTKVCLTEASSSSAKDSDAFVSPYRTSTEAAPSASVLSISPATITSSHLPSFKIIDLLTKSTIYRRHEARMVRSYALRDDPRPALIRVMSGLPGLKIIFHPFRPAESVIHGPPNHRGKLSAPTIVVPGAFSEETLFHSYSNGADNTVGTEATGRITATTDYTSASTTGVPEHIVQAMLATGFCSGMAEYGYAYWRKSRQKHVTTSSSSPFHSSNITGSLGNNTKNALQHSSMFVRLKSTLASNITGPRLYNEIPSTVNKNRVLKGMSNNAAGLAPSALSMAFPTSLLFGAKVLLDSVLEHDQQNDENTHYHVANHILSSAFAGAVVGSSQLARLRVQDPQQLQSTSLSMVQQQRLTASEYHRFSLMRANIVAAVLYFSIYDGVSSLSTNTRWPSNIDTAAESSGLSTIRNDSSSTKNGTLNILLGGALAGVAHTASMQSHLYGQYGSMIWWSRIMLPAISRAAPIHAFVFYGYEKIKDWREAVL